MSSAPVIPRKCPKCSADTFSHELDAVTRADVCPQCNGMWLKKGVLARSAGVEQDLPDLLHSIRNSKPSPFSCQECEASPALMTLPLTSGGTPEVEYCKFCEGIFFDRKEFPLAKSVLRPIAVESELSDSPKIHPPVLAVPVALLIAFIFAASGNLLTWYFFSIPIHELGHTLAAFLRGGIAIPLGAIIPMAGITFLLSPGRSAVVCGLILFGLWFLFRMGRRERLVFFPSLCAGLALGAVYLTVLAPEPVSTMVAIYGGQAGEFVLGTLLVISFFYEMPKKLYWDVFRYFALIPGSNAFAYAFLLWMKIKFGNAALPMGSFLGDATCKGDLDRLFGEFGWTPKELTDHFVRLGVICVLVIGGHIFFFWRSGSGKEDEFKKQ